MERVDLMSLSGAQMEEFVRGLGWPRYRAAQILQWIYVKGAVVFSEMTNLAQSDRDRLEKEADLGRMECARRLLSSDGTEKFLFSFSDGTEIESVLIPGEDTDETPLRHRLTLCISTQAGCTLDCRFCLTGTMGLLRNLTAGEIVQQVLEMKRRGHKITNVVLMGMGEPLANYKEVVEAISRLTDPKLVGISPRRITLSTAGMAPQIRRLAESGLKMNLAVSLNATTDDVRDRIMPQVNKLHPLKDLLAACRSYRAATRKKLFFEYVLLSKLNDTAEDARRLVGLLKGIPSKVNLIPFNEYPGSPFRRPSDPTILKFQKILMDAGMTAFIRKSRGRDILAACGQLKTEPGDADLQTVAPVARRV